MEQILYRPWSFWTAQTLSFSVSIGFSASMTMTPIPAGLFCAATQNPLRFLADSNTPISRRPAQPFHSFLPILERFHNFLIGSDTKILLHQPP
jgi:hypothetical protein